ncbi:glycosyltransferase family 2 protein [Streptococcus sp. P25B114]
MKKITIVIPVYNVQGYLKECLDSIVEFLTSEIEVIIINDGSTDDSESICLDYCRRFKHIKYIYQTNQGLSAARNAGIRSSNGEYILFIDSDDFINGKVIDSLIDRIKSPKDIIFLRAVKYYGNNNIKDFGENYNRDDIFKKSQVEVLKYLSGFRKFPGSAWNKLVRRDFLIDNNLYFEEGLYSEDLEWSFRLFNVAKIFDSVDNEVYYYYRCNREGSITNTISQKNIDSLLYILKKYIDFPFAQDIRESLYSFLSYEYLIAVYLLSKIKLENNDIISELEEIRKILWKSNKLEYRLIYVLISIFGLKFISKLLKMWRD